jgi:hypothetical protein
VQLHKYQTKTKNNLKINIMAQEIVKTTKEEEKQIDPAEIDAYFDASMLIGFQKLDFKDIKVHDP